MAQIGVDGDVVIESGGLVIHIVDSADVVDLPVGRGVVHLGERGLRHSYESKKEEKATKHGVFFCSGSCREKRPKKERKGTQRRTLLPILEV